MDDLKDNPDRVAMLEIALVNIAIAGISKARCANISGAKKETQKQLLESLNRLADAAIDRVIEIKVKIDDNVEQ